MMGYQINRSNQRGSSHIPCGHLGIDPVGGTSWLALAKFPEGMPERMGKRRLFVKSNQSWDSGTAKVGNNIWRSGRSGATNRWGCDFIRFYLPLNGYEWIEMGYNMI